MVAQINTDPASREELIGEIRSFLKEWYTKTGNQSAISDAVQALDAVLDREAPTQPADPGTSDLSDSMEGRGYSGRGTEAGTEDESTVFAYFDSAKHVIVPNQTLTALERRVKTIELHQEQRAFNAYHLSTMPPGSLQAARDAVEVARDALVKACLKYEPELREMLLAKCASHPVTYCIFAYRRELSGQKKKI